MIYPLTSEEVQPGKYAQKHMFFRLDDVPDLVPLVDVEDVLKILDQDYRMLALMFMYFPAAEAVPLWISSPRRRTTVVVRTFLDHSSGLTKMEGRSCEDLGADR